MRTPLTRLVRIVVAAAGLSGIASTAWAETITVTHWGSAFYGAPYAIAQEKGFFKKRGLDITGFLTSAGGGTSVRNTLAGDLPFGEVALPAAILAIQSGQPLKIISGGVESVGDIVWVEKTDGKIGGIKDLAGKKVAYTSSGSVTNMVILMCLQKAGIDQKALQLVTAGDIGANMSAVLNGAVDAGMSGEPILSQNKDKTKVAFRASDCTNPAITQTVGITTTEYAASGAEKLRALLDARREGVAFIKQNPEEAADIVAKAFNGDAALYRRVFKELVAIDYFGDGRIYAENINRMLDGMKLVGRLRAPVDLGTITDPSFLPKELRATN